MVLNEAGILWKKQHASMLRNAVPRYLDKEAKEACINNLTAVISQVVNASLTMFFQKNVMGCSKIRFVHSQREAHHARWEHVPSKHVYYTVYERLLLPCLG